MNFKKGILPTVITLWAAAIGVGMVWITDYTLRPGRSAISPVNLPVAGLSEPTLNLPKLLIFLHPQCPCSRATLAELAVLTARYNGLADVRVLFYQPSSQSREWVETDLWHRASAIPNVAVATISEEEIKKFGAITSGQVLLYDTQRHLVFSGGITRGRGHQGDNAGRESIEDFLQTGETTVAHTPVFGCILSASE